MRNFFFLLSIIFSTNVTAQSDTILSLQRSVIALDKVKTIYRGIANPISIAVSNCKSFKVEGIGVEKFSEGKYTISPGQGLETKIVVTITNFDDSILVEEHSFKIANVPMLLAKINNQNCYNCIVELSKKEIENAVITIGWNDVKIDLVSKFYEITDFTLSISGINRINIEGNRFSEEGLKEINKLKVGTEFYILDVRYPNPYNVFRMTPTPIKIRIKE